MPSPKVYEIPSGAAYGYPATTDPTADQTTHLLSSSGGAPATATFLTKVDETATLPNSVPLPSLVKGVLYVANGATITALLIGTDGQVLTADSTQPNGVKWAAGGAGSSPLTTKGDLFGHAAVDARVPVGSDNQFLVANSGVALGINYRAIVAGDIPTLNQNTTGTANNVTGIVAVANGGTNAATAPAALTNLGALPLAGGTMTGDLVLAGDPNAALKAATKQYVDAVAAGLSPKNAVTEATIAALPANIYANGASGVGATLTAVATGALTVDGQPVALNDRILVKNEAAAANNGLYLCTVAGAVGVAYVLTRTTDMDQPAEVPGAFTFVENGTVNAGAGFVVANSGPFTIGTTAIVWTQFSGAGEITAGTGLTKSGNTLSLTIPVTIATGGTSATTAPAARTGLVIDQLHNVADADYTIVSTDRTVFYTSITAARALTLPAASSINAGQTLVIGDTSGSVSTTNTITVNRAGADLIDGAATDVLNVSFSVRTYTSDGVSKWTIDKSTFQAVAGAGVTLTNDTGAKTTTFTSKGVNYQQLTAAGTATWTKPANALAVYVEIIGAGGGGGGGMSGAAGGIRGGGGGAGAGGRKRAWMDPADLGATETMTAGTGGPGGAGGGTGGAVGVAGTTGTLSSFGAHLSVTGGTNGNGGTAAPGGAGGSGSLDSEIANSLFVSTLLSSSQGGTTSSTATGQAGGGGANLPGGAGAGGSLDAANVQRAGGAGGAGQPAAVITGGTGGTTAGGNGGNGTATTLKHQMGAGGGGGGAGSTNAVKGGNGGTGSAPGAGGGGGGAALSGGTAIGGTGGTGGDGSVRVWTYVGSGA